MTLKIAALLMTNLVANSTEVLLDPLKMPEKYEHFYELRQNEFKLNKSLFILDDFGLGVGDDKNFFLTPGNLDFSKVEFFDQSGQKISETELIPNQETKIAKGKSQKVYRFTLPQPATPLKSICSVSNTSDVKVCLAVKESDFTTSSRKKKWLRPISLPDRLMLNGGPGKLSGKISIGTDYVFLIGSKDEYVTISSKAQNQLISKNIKYAQEPARKTYLSKTDEELTVVGKKPIKFSESVVVELDRFFLKQKLSKGENQVRFSAKYDDQEEYYFDTYLRAPSDEVSLSTSMAYNSAGITPLAEFGWTKWYENFAFVKSDFFKRRWGTSVRYYKSLTDIEFPGYKNSFQALSVDLKTRWTPGVWGKDESVGSQISFLQTGFADEIRAQYGGFGVFWVRPLPTIFDRVLNFIPWLRYPKWVDAQITYYPFLIDSDLKGSAIVLAAQGKMNFTQSSFLAGGISYRGFIIDRKNPPASGQIRDLQATAVYGTLGLGYDF